MIEIEKSYLKKLMTNIIMVVVKKKLLCIIKKNKEVIKKRERDIYKSMTDIERNEKIKKSLDRYYKLKSTI